MMEIPSVKKLSIVIPVYNEMQTIEAVVERVIAVPLPNIQKEIIISDDGSTDATPNALSSIYTKHADIVRIYTSPTNLGKGAAVRLGMSIATGDIIIIQDADLELDPAEYQKILKPILDGKAEVVYGSRFKNHNRQISLRTRLANKLLTSLTNILFHGKLSDMETAYKAFLREVLKSIKLRCVRFDFEPEITAKLLMAGYKIKEVAISYNPRTVDEGKKISWRDGFEAVYTLFRCRFIDLKSI
jgi:glycosyltransferase involved in cell wall biosynthesis